MQIKSRITPEPRLHSEVGEDGEEKSTSSTKQIHMLQYMWSKNLKEKMQYYVQLHSITRVKNNIDGAVNSALRPSLLNNACTHTIVNIGCGTRCPSLDR